MQALRTNCQHLVAGHMGQLIAYTPVTNYH
jgi:hypothetical protein